MDSQEVFLSGPRVDLRYGISAMTRWRWQRDARLGFPNPISINGRKLWRVSDLQSWERARSIMSEAPPAMVKGTANQSS